MFEHIFIYEFEHMIKSQPGIHKFIYDLNVCQINQKLIQQTIKAQLLKQVHQTFLASISNPIILTIVTAIVFGSFSSKRESTCW